MPERFRILSYQDGLGVAVAGPVLLVVWRQAVTLERFLRQRNALNALADRHPEGIGFLCVVEESAPPPDNEMRKASTSMVTALGSRLRCVTCVIEGQGFRAATARSVLAGMAFLLRSDAPAARFVATIAEGAAITTRSCAGVSQDELVEAHAKLIAQMNA